MGILMKQLLCALALAPMLAGSAAHAKEIDERHYIYIEASASVTAKADTTTISISISEKGETAQIAIAQTTEKSTKFMESLTALGVPMSDIETVQFRFEPVYIIATDSDGKPVATWPDPDRDQLDGFRATNQLAIKMRDFAKVGQFLSQAAGMGVEINAVNFSSTRKDEFASQADQKAAESALVKAHLYAKSLGVELGALLATREGTGYSADTMEYPADYGEGQADLMAETGLPVPVAPPTLTFYGSISAKWEITPTQPQ